MTKEELEADTMETHTTEATLKCPYCNRELKLNVSQMSDPSPKGEMSRGYKGGW